MSTFRSMGTDVVVLGASAAELRAVERLFAERDARFSRFSADSELSHVNRTQLDPVLLSPDFARTLAAALDAARATGGLVTPTVAAALAAAGYDRDFDQLRDAEPPQGVAEVPSWRRLQLSGRLLFRILPNRSGPIQLDLNGVVKSQTVDDALALLAASGSVSAGGDMATTKPVVVELPEGDGVQLHGGGLATSGTDRRRWRRGGEEQHHLIDPAMGRPATSPWRQVTVSAGSCLAADVAAKAALLLGHAGPSWLDRRGLAGRFVDASGRVTENERWRAALVRAAA